MTPFEKAESAYEGAKQCPSESTWATAAHLLYVVRRKPRLPSGGKSKGRYPFPIAKATFADARTISMTFWSQRGKPLDWERAKRVCTSGYKLIYGFDYKLPHGDDAMPTIIHIREKISGETWSPA